MEKAHNTKTNDLRYQNLQNLILKSQNLSFNLKDALYKATYKVTSYMKLLIQKNYEIELKTL